MTIDILHRNNKDDTREMTDGPRMTYCTCDGMAMNSLFREQEGTAPPRGLTDWLPLQMLPSVSLARVRVTIATTTIAHPRHPPPLGSNISDSSWFLSDWLTMQNELVGLFMTDLFGFQHCHIHMLHHFLPVPLSHTHKPHYSNSAPSILQAPPIHHCQTHTLHHTSSPSILKVPLLYHFHIFNAHTHWHTYRAFQDFTPFWPTTATFTAVYSLTDTHKKLLSWIALQCMIK